MDDPVAIVVITFTCFIIVLLLIKGAIKTFKRQPVVAILCIIFLFPIYVIWAFCELFTGRVNKE